MKIKNEIEIDLQKCLPGICVGLRKKGVKLNLPEQKPTIKPMQRSKN